MSRLTLSKALTSHVARRFVRLATIIAFAILVSVIVICAVLAYFFSAWWWLLLIPFVMVFGAFLVVRLVLLFIIGRVHTASLNQDQKQGLDDFTAKLERLIEARGTPPIFFVILTIKDLLIHRDITTVKELIRDTTSLRSDFEKLDKLF